MDIKTEETIHREKIDLIMRQATYSLEDANKKLEEYDGNAELVIRDFYNLNVKKDNTQNKSINQNIYSNIRSFMDKTKSSLKD